VVRSIAHAKQLTNTRDSNNHVIIMWRAGEQFMFRRKAVKRKHFIRIHPIVFQSQEVYGSHKVDQYSKMGLTKELQGNDFKRS